MWILLYSLVAILWIVLSTSKFKIHPLIALLFAAIYVGVTVDLVFLDCEGVFGTFGKRSLEILYKFDRFDGADRIIDGVIFVLYFNLI